MYFLSAINHLFSAMLLSLLDGDDVEGELIIQVICMNNERRTYFYRRKYEFNIIGKIVDDHDTYNRPITSLS